MHREVDDVDRQIARDAILNASRKLAVGAQARLDRNVVRSAFPPGIDDRTAELQVVHFLRDVSAGAFACRPMDDGDFVVSRRDVAAEPDAAPAAKSTRTGTKARAPAPKRAAKGGGKSKAAAGRSGSKAKSPQPKARPGRR
jgi:hypothetical protein